MLTLIAIFLIASVAFAKDKPPFYKKAETARWLVNENLWGTLSTTSIHLKGQAWGQPKSFVDGTTTNSTGNIYMYDSDMDTSVQDTAANPKAAFSISMAQQGICPVAVMDPESPTCARVVISGTFVEITDTQELAFAKSALFERHPTMTTWPDDHNWKVHKILMDEIWLIDIYGGASIITPDDYFAIKVTAK